MRELYKNTVDVDTCHGAFLLHRPESETQGLMEGYQLIIIDEFVQLSREQFERIIRLHLEAFDWNCPQYITPRFTEAELTEALRPVRDRIAELEAENAALRAALQTQGGAARGDGVLSPGDDAMRDGEWRK